MQGTFFLVYRFPQLRAVPRLRASPAASYGMTLHQRVGNDIWRHVPSCRHGQSLLLVFEESILPTHRSKFVQFVLFFASGRSPGLGHALTSKLVEVLKDEKRPKVSYE